MPDLAPGAVLTLDVEKAVAGGRMLARHEGGIVLVTGAIPGERVRARVVRVVAHTAHAAVVEVLDSSEDRCAVEGEAGCGGQVLSHIAYPRQLALKAEILQDACSRIGHLAIERPEVVPSLEQGYRMRARLHGHNGRIGFYREGTHQICDAGATGQLLPATVEWLRRLESLYASGDLNVAALELTENVAGTDRACHLELRRPPRHAAIDTLVAEGARGGVSWSLDSDSEWGVDSHTPGRSGQERPRRRPQVHADDDQVVHGDAALVDLLRSGATAEPFALRRHARAFFQGNRYLLEPLLQHVVAAVGEGAVLDLYAGVGLFGLGAAALARGPVVLVEGDAVSGADLLENAAPFPEATVWPVPVEDFLGSPSASGRQTLRTVIVDPPRTGMLPNVVKAIVALQPARVIFVSCDPATFARDARLLVDGGFSLAGLTLFDLFPGTAHVESVGIFDGR